MSGRFGQHALADVVLDRVVEALVKGLEEVMAAQPVGQALEHGVVEHQRTQERLFGLQVVRQRGDGDGVDGEGDEGVHCVNALPVARPCDRPGRSGNR